MSESIILGYWGIRGRGQVPRLLLAYTGAEWTQKKYYSQDDWKGIGKDQTSLGLPFPNLPYLIQGDIKLSQSRAIMNYIINISEKHQLLGKNLKDQAIINNIVSVLAELLSKSIQLALNVENFDKKYPQVEKFVETKLINLQSFCSGDKFIFGYLTLADFMLAQTSYYVQNIFPEIYKKLSFLHTIKQAFQNVDQIKNYYAKQIAVKGPFLPPIGKVKF